MARLLCNYDVSGFNGIKDRKGYEVLIMRGTKLTDKEYEVLKIIKIILDSNPRDEYLPERQQMVFHNLVNYDDEVCEE